MIRIGHQLHIPEGEIRLEFTHASGPGGQNVNKVATAVQLRFDVGHSPSLPEEVRNRLLRLGGNRVTSDGVLVIDARRFRSQERNRQDALERLTALLTRALIPPKPRVGTMPSRAARARRLEAKRHRSRIKRLRHKGAPGSDDGG